MKDWHFRLLIIVAVLGFAGEGLAQRAQRRPVTEDERRAAIAELDRFTSPTLTRFGSEAEFHRYIEALREVERTRGSYYYDYGQAVRRIRLAQAMAPRFSPARPDVTAPLCDPEIQICPGDEAGEDSIIVTGS